MSEQGGDAVQWRSLPNVQLEDFRVGLESGHVVARLLLVGESDDGSTIVSPIAVLIEPAQARELAADLTQRADGVEDGRE